jgi:hypothetical protein
VNGLGTSADTRKASEIFQATLGAQISILAMAETNTNWNKRQTRHATTTDARTFFPQMKASFSASTLTTRHDYQPGGTATFVTGEWTSLVANYSNDKSGLGRWNTVTFRGPTNHKVTIITAYAVIRTTIHQAGPTTAFAQQWHLLRRDGIQNPDPHKQF